MPDYIPSRDGDFSFWLENFITYASANAAALGIAPADITKLTTRQGAWTTGLADHTTAQNAARAACEVKDNARDGLEETIRAIVRQIQASPTVTDEQRRAKPDGVLGAEIWIKIGDPAPVDSSQCVFVAMDTSSPYVLDFEGKNANLRAYYMLRWVTSHSDKGPWSETITTTIVG